MLALAGLPSSANADETPVTSAGLASIADDARPAALQALADSSGALGVYVDETTKDYVVVVPASGGATFDVTKAPYGLNVRVETRDIDRPTIDQIGSALDKFVPTVGSSAGYGFDPKSGKMTLTSGAPESAFASIESQFPGKISYRQGWFEPAGWTSDTAPYKGGAYLDGQYACTSGFSLDFNSGGRYMVTAGHCNTNGHSTNMGTAWRESPAWDYWDFELIGGKTYSPKIYDSGSTTRPVINASNPSVGSTYCTTGRSSGFKCYWVVRKLNQTVYYADSGHTFHDLVEFYRPSHDDHIIPGDSGGPLWYPYCCSPFGAGIRGVISGYGWDLFEGYNSYATQYQSIANYYVAHAALG